MKTWLIRKDIMSTKLIHFSTFMLLFTVACDEKKKEITQELCERQTNRADCEAIGCMGGLLLDDS